MRRWAGLVVGTLAVTALAGCASASQQTPTGATGNKADATFLQDMISHHEQAIAAGQLAASMGTDPRVVAFGKRIVREQTPELQKMQRDAQLLGLHLSASAGAAMAVNRITPQQLAALKGEPAAQRDHDLIADSARSEMGAVTMADVEIKNGVYEQAMAVAKAIAGAPYSEIPQLQALAAQLPR